MSNSKNKKIAFFGTPSFTVDFLKMFKKNGFDISLVVTGEDRPSGRGMQVRPPGPKLWAIENNVKFLQPQKLSEIVDDLQGFDLFIVIAYGKIIPEKIINLPKHGTINLHYSLLPKYRGASPVETAILNGEKETGITIQQMVYQLDAGNILLQEKLKIEANETTTELRARLNQKALELFPSFLEKYFNPGLQEPGISQEESQVTHCGKFSKEDLDVTNDLQNQDLETIYKKYKAFDKKIYFFHNHKRVKITSMTEIEILKVLPESKKEISINEFENAFGKIF